MIRGVTLVTGASGFVGTHLCRSLLLEGTRVRGLTRSGVGLLPGVEVATCADLNDRPALRAAVNEVDTVVHLAARVHMMQDRSLDQLEAYRRTNVEGTRVLVEEAARAGVGRMLLLSTVKAVGESTNVPWTEATQPNPVDAYGISKLEAERVALDVGARSGLRVSVLRLPLVYGPGMKANMLRLFEAVDRGRPLPLGGIRNRRSLVFVGNAVAAMILLIDTPAAAGEVFFVRDRHDLSSPELVRAVANALDRPTRLIPAPRRLFMAGGKLGDLLPAGLRSPLTSAAVARLFGSLVVDSSKIFRVAGFEPPFSTEEGLRLTAEWYLGHRAQ